MKRLLYIITIGLSLTACDMDKYPLDAVSPDTFFDTENDLRLYSNSFYDALPSASDIYGEAVDNIITMDLADEIRGTRIVPTNGGGWTWKELRNINFYLDNSYKCADEAARLHYDALARFFRAYFYFDKVKRFGDVPWYEHALNDKDEEGLMMPRTSRTEVLDHILADIDNAITYLPREKKVNEVTHWTALALKARICLYEGTFRKYHDEFNLPDYERFLNEAVNAADELMTKSEYKIYSTGKPESDYLNFFASHEASKDEVILARGYSDEFQVYHNLNYYTMTASFGRPGLEKRLVNSYLMRDGKRFTDRLNYDTMFFTEEMKGRDPRLSQTVRTPGYTRIGENEPLVQELGSTVTGYQMIKFVTERKWDTNNKDINDMPLFRFAEALLIYAEAKAELGTLTQADLDKSVKLLRDRVDMPSINMEEANASPDPYLEKQYPHVME